MTEHKVKLDRANKSILLRALGAVYYGQRARGGSAEETGRADFAGERSARGRQTDDVGGRVSAGKSSSQPTAHPALG